MPSTEFRKLVRMEAVKENIKTVRRMMSADLIEDKEDVDEELMFPWVQKIRQAQNRNGDSNVTTADCEDNDRNGRVSCAKEDVSSGGETSSSAEDFTESVSDDDISAVRLRDLVCKNSSCKDMFNLTVDEDNRRCKHQSPSTRIRRKVSVYAMDVQRKISTKEIKKIFPADDKADHLRTKDKNLSKRHKTKRKPQVRGEGKRNERAERASRPLTKITRTSRGTFETYTTDENSSLRELSMDMTEDTMSAKDLQSLIEKRTDERRKNLVEKFVGALTLHGYAQFHEATGIRKFLWALILAAMAVFIVRLTYLSYRSENYYKQVIEFETEKMKNIDFPTVTICNFSPIYSRKMYQRFQKILQNVKITEQEFKQFYYSILSNRRQIISNEIDQKTKNLHFHIIHQLRIKGYDTYMKILKLFEKHEEEDINSVVVQNVMERYKCLYENKSCKFKDVFTTVYRHTSQSLCKQFNFYEKHKEHGLYSAGNDIYNGLFMFVDISGNNYFYDYGLNGLLLEIHPYGTPHHLIDHRHTIYLEPGAATNIDIEQVVTKRLPPPFKPNCGQRELKIIKDYPYSQAMCEVDCFLQQMFEKCGCVVDQFAQFVPNTRICNISEMACTFEVAHDSECHECPVNCTAIGYKVSTSRLGIGTDLVFQTLRQSKEWKKKSRSDIERYVNLNIVGFRIGFKTLEKQIRVYKEAVPWYERISMLGGIMGLLLGFSVITGFELLFFLFDYLYITMKYRCTKEYLATILKQESMKTKTAMQRRAERNLRS